MIELVTEEMHGSDSGLLERLSGLICHRPVQTCPRHRSSTSDQFRNL